jgi:hypothetical protein
MYEIAKEVCYILEVTHEGTRTVKKFQITCRDLIPGSLSGNANITPQGALHTLNLGTYIFDIIKIIK